MHILAATDGSEHARQALEFARLLAVQAHARMTVLGVAEEAGKARAAQRSIDEARRLLDEHAIQYTTKLRYGHAAEQILQEIERGDYDLIVMGARGRSRLTRFLLGSVSFRVLEHATIPVLIVRRTRPQIKKILVATGGHPESTATMRFGAQLAHTLGATETLLHVTNAVPRMYIGLDEMDETLPELLRSDTQEGRMLRAGAQMMDAENVEGRLELRYGIVEDEIIHEAVQGDYDLIVVGSSAPAGPIGRLLVGNVTRRVIDYTQRPVLVVPGNSQKN